MAGFDCFGGYQALQSVPWRTPAPVGVPLPLCSPAASQHNVFHMSSLRSKVGLRIVHATGALLGGAMTQEGRIRPIPTRPRCDRRTCDHGAARRDALGALRTVDAGERFGGSAGVDARA
jgi:hypothetical protein